ncbi:Rab-like_protein [Hexamita inflata]|uniref:Rab-like protein n=1 Tax=Hexamita inflata TaxID=28002 RepID=A0AA86UB41_9EUKA|nr:Rab-like protein [Hexamita inflata]CAI9945611.1 Rab-like protein [Hexamita inflata]
MKQIKCVLYGSQQTGKTYVLRQICNIPHTPYEPTIGVDIGHTVLNGTKINLFECGCSGFKFLEFFTQQYLKNVQFALVLFSLNYQQYFQGTKRYLESIQSKIDEGEIVKIILVGVKTENKEIEVQNDEITQLAEFYNAGYTEIGFEDHEGIREFAQRICKIEQ